jgi:single-strand DNA-binding protein
MHSKIIIVGNLGKDPEMRYAPNGKAVTNFSVATSRKYTDSDGQKVSETTWYRVTTWDKRAEVCNQYLSKGSKVYIEGRLIPDPKTGGPKIWQGQNGPGASFEVNADTVIFLSSRGDGDNGHAEPTTEPVTEELPF